MDSSKLGLRVLDQIRSSGPASPIDVYRNLGSASSYPAVRKSMRRLHERGKLLRQDGKYQVLPVDNELDSTFAYFEGEIANFLCQNGGAAHTGEIHTAMWGWVPRSRAERPSEYYLVYRVLKESTLFRQDLGRGLWNLDPDKGSWSGRWQLHRLKSDNARLAYCQKVGDAFSDARGDLTLRDVVGTPEIASALDTLISHLRPSLRVLLVGNGAADRLSLIAQAEAYARFERGEVAIHLAAPSTLYSACAALFGTDAASFSR